MPVAAAMGQMHGKEEKVKDTRDLDRQRRGFQLTSIRVAGTRERKDEHSSGGSEALDKNLPAASPFALSATAQGSRAKLKPGGFSNLTWVPPKKTDTKAVASKTQEPEQEHPDPVAVDDAEEEPCDDEGW